MTHAAIALAANRSTLKLTAMLRPEFRALASIDRQRIVMPTHTTLRLNRLERPQPWHPDLLAEVSAAIRLGEIQQYPDYNSFYEQLAAFVGVSPHNIVVGAGIEEFIRTLMLISVAPGETVTTLWPTCAMFEVYARAFGLNLVRIVTDPDKPPTINDIINQLPNNTRLFVLSNPGQPVDTCYGLEDIEALANVCKDRGCVLAIDEAYYGFGAPTSASLVFIHDNVVVLRTFSKAFGAAGIRLGYAIAGSTLAKTLHAVRQSGEVSGISMAIASVLMKHYQTYIQSNINGICAARDWLVAILRERGLKARGRWANHVLIGFNTQEQRYNAYVKLYAFGVLTKANFDEPLDKHMLVTCGNLPTMKLFYDTLEKKV